MQDINFFVSALKSVDRRVISAYQKPSVPIHTHDKCISIFKELHHVPNFFLTKSCTQSLEMAIAGLDLPSGSEVILPSYAFVSCANAINNHGYYCVFTDCEPDTMNISPEAIEAAISPATRAILVINYGGVACDYDRIIPLCKKYGLILIEDNAHGFLAKYNNRCLGNFGDISVISFDHMKNISCEEGGGITINNTSLLPKFDQALEFGTNRLAYFNKEVPLYEWKSKGSNCYLAESLSEILYTQLLDGEMIIRKLQQNWKLYHHLLSPLHTEGIIRIAQIPGNCETNGHIFWIKLSDQQIRSELITYLKSKQIFPAFHYAALHLSEYGKKVGVFRGDDTQTSTGSRTILRLPQHHFLSVDQITYVVRYIFDFFKISFNP